MRTILEDLRPHGRVALDTNACVYYLGSAPKWATVVNDVMTLPVRRSELCIPDIVRLELLVKPYRMDDPEETTRVRQFLAERSRIAIDEAVIDAAAQLRSITRLRTPDALIAACAAVGRCNAIVGNDSVFKDLNAMKGMTLFAAGQAARIPQYIHLDDYVEA